MVDFIALDTKLFLEVKDTIVVPDGIKEFYEELFQAVDCFQSNGFVSKPYVKKVDPSKKFIAKKSFARTIRKPLCTGEQPHIKKVKTILNVLNASNFEKLIHKLKFVIDDHNVEEVVCLILSTAVSQYFFVKVFVNLLLEISNIYRPTVRKSVATFIENYLNMNLASRMILEDNLSEYDIFCQVQKEKTQKISTGMLIVHLINDGFYEETLDWFVSQLMNYCQKDDVLDIVLPILIETKKVAKQIMIAIPESVKERCGMSNKLRFLLADLQPSTL